jgi:hypothetical protein
MRTHTTHVPVAGLVLLSLFGWGTRADAQAVASSFDQLTVLVKPGDRITVTDATGAQADGRIGSLTRDVLTFVTPAGPRDLHEADVAQIRQRRGDSLRNGAIIGAVAGTAYYATVLALLYDGDGGDLLLGPAITAGVVMAGVGAAAGAGIDALIARRQVIYRKPGGGTTLRVAPVVGRGRRGIAVAVTF